MSSLADNSIEQHCTLQLLTLVLNVVVHAVAVGTGTGIASTSGK